MTETDLQQLCERGQELLMSTRYWDAEHVLAQAEQAAWDARDWDSLARLYMPLQEARRQRRQRCGEGIVALDLVAEGPGDRIDPAHVITNYPHGQLLVAGWGTIEPALGVRELADRKGLYIETFLAAAYPVDAAVAIVIVPTADVSLPSADRAWPIDALLAALPAHAIVLAEAQLFPQCRRGDAQTYARTMSLWEQLAAPFLASAGQTLDPIGRMKAYRQTIKVDYACELAHQKLSDAARCQGALQNQQGAGSQ